MDDLDLRRMFDQIAPTQEQEVTMLDRLHRTEREEQTMKRGMKRGLVALVAAALMMTAAFAVAAGLDQRLMDYFGIGQEDLNLVSNGIVQVDKTHAYKNGWTVAVKQLLFDRYCGEILVDLTAPEGTVLTEQDYRMDFRVLPTNRDLTGQGWVDNIIYFDGTNWRYMDPTFASSGKGDAAVSNYISNQANYQAKFTY